MIYFRQVSHEDVNHNQRDEERILYILSSTEKNNLLGSTLWSKLSTTDSWNESIYKARFLDHIEPNILWMFRE